MSKKEVFSGPYFPVFSPNTRKYGPEKTACLDTLCKAKEFEILVKRYFNDISGRKVKKLAETVNVDWKRALALKQNRIITIQN